MSRAAQDVLGVLRGLQVVAEACGREHLALTKHLWSNSSVRELLADNVSQTVDAVRTKREQPTEEIRKLQELLQETGERGYVVAKGLCQLIETKLPCDLAAMQKLNWQPGSATGATAGQAGANAAGLAAGGAAALPGSSRSHLDAADAANLDISSITLLEFEEILSKRNKNRNVSLRTPTTQSKQLPSEAQPTLPSPPPPPTAKPPSPTKLSSKQEGILAKDTEHVDNLMRFVAGNPIKAKPVSPAAPAGEYNASLQPHTLLEAVSFDALPHI